MNKIEAARNLPNEEYAALIKTHDAHVRSLGGQERAKRTLDNVTKIERNPKEGYWAVHFTDGEWYHYTPDGRWY